jgi:hypothetical protein
MGDVMSPEQLEEYGPDDDFDDDGQEDAQEWQEGQCDQCSGPPRMMDEQAATLASAIVPVCACWMGHGAAPEHCKCGPERVSA